MKEEDLVRCINRVASAVAATVRHCVEYNPPNPRAMGSMIAKGGHVAIIALIASSKGSAAQHAYNAACEQLQAEVNALPVRGDRSNPNATEAMRQALLDLGD